ncbi:MAG: ankyrin repeat domain-containing protein [Candidatus Methanoplasma sp.]|jgi:ankyrin repeat protein|nr:ankyrin repeat domain-containing protein [Candidatus Methanoplasma sp.]
MQGFEIKRLYSQEGQGRDAALEGYRALLAENPDGLSEEAGQELVILAADFAHAEALSLLFEAGVSASINEWMEFTLLHILARREESRSCVKPEGAVAACVNLLLDNKVSALRKDRDGRVCYHYAAQEGMHEFAEALAARGAKLNMTDGHGNTGIHIACEYVGRALRDIDYAKEKVERAKKEYAETVADMSGKGKTEEEIAEYMQTWKKGLTANADKERAELVAAEQRAEDYFLTVKTFAEAGVDADEKNSYGELRALEIAVNNGAKKIAAYLSGTLSEGDEGAIKAGGMTLHQAAEKGDAEAIRALAGRGEDINGLKDADEYSFGGCTPLAIACVFLQPEAAAALLECGADPNFRNGQGRAALSYIANDLKASVSGKIFEEKRIPKMIKDMISAGLDINRIVDDDGDTLLIQAAKSHRGQGYGNYTVKGVLIDEALRQKADINLSNRFGETALMHVCARDFKAMENAQITLLEQGADVAAADRNGDTALHYAARNDDKNGARVLCDMLLEFGADANAVNNDGKTALDIAGETDNEPLAKLLLGKM